MNDRFKHRGFHKPTKKLFDVYGFNQEFVFKNTLDGVGASPCNPAKIEDCKLIQCTGLRDCEGNLIYEGDILEYHHYIYKNKSEGIKFSKKCIVEWFDNEIKFRFSILNEVDASYPALETRTKIEFKIIGNIYENPELLKTD